MRERHANRLIIATFGLIALALSWGAGAINRQFPVAFLADIHSIFLLVGFVVFSVLLLEYFISNKISHGLHYFWVYRTVRSRLERQLLDAGYCIQRSYYMELPKIVLSFNQALTTGELRLRNAIKFDKRLDNVNLSAALGKFVVENHYVSDDGNEYVYFLLDSSISFKLVFKNYEAFLACVQDISPYKLLLDGRSVVKLQHMLLAGRTGSGKSVMLIFLVLQMINKTIPYCLYFADAKGSAHALLGKMLAPERTAIEITDIAALLKEFVERMHDRQRTMEKLLQGNITGDYTDFSLKPFVFLFEEFGAVVKGQSKEDKKAVEEINALLSKVILQGRQLGFFVVLTCQQPSAQTISTDLRENLPLKILLNPVEEQTRIVTFGHGVDIPNRNYLVGEGVFTEPELAPVPRLIQCPFYEFDIVDALSRGGVTTPAPEKKVKILRPSDTKEGDNIDWSGD